MGIKQEEGFGLKKILYMKYLKMNVIQEHMFMSPTPQKIKTKNTHAIVNIWKKIF